MTAGFLDHTGTIQIDARNLSQDEHGESPGDYVRVAVTDTGMGMTPEVKDRVFEPFFTTKDVGKGSGLGLPQVYGFAKQSGGGVDIQTAVGQGTSVILILPRSTAQRVDDSHGSSKETSLQTEQNSAVSVLLVEDNDDVAMLVGEMLQELGYKVERAADALAALRILTSTDTINVVFSDIVMPGGIDGVELGRQIRRHRNNVLVLLTSGYAHGAVQRAEREGFRVLAKPYDLSALANALQRIRQDSSESVPDLDRAQ